MEWKQLRKGRDSFVDFFLLKLRFSGKQNISLFCGNPSQSPAPSEKPPSACCYEKKYLE